jgi:hypothetical protein
LTLDQYESIVDAGMLGEKDHVHLIDGFLVARKTQNDPDATADELCGRALSHVVPAGWHLRVGKPIRLPKLASKPEPDRSVVRGAVRDYARRSPEPADIALVAEVSDTRLADDQKLAGVYGRAGIPFSWIINVVAGQVEDYSWPGPSGHESVEALAPGHSLTVVIDGVEVGETPVDDLWP